MYVDTSNAPQDEVWPVGDHSPQIWSLQGQVPALRKGTGWGGPAVLILSPPEVPEQHRSTTDGIGTAELIGWEVIGRNPYRPDTQDLSSQDESGKTPFETKKRSKGRREQTTTDDDDTDKRTGEQCSEKASNPWEGQLPHEEDEDMGQSAQHPRQGRICQRSWLSHMELSKCVSNHFKVAQLDLTTSFIPSFTPLRFQSQDHHGKSE